MGHSDTEGKYSRGVAIPKISELDIVDYYLPEVVEQLEIACVPYEVMNTRKWPGTKPEARAALIEELHIVVELAIGWHKKPLQRNGSCIYFAHEDAKKFAWRISEALTEWGRCTAFSHSSHEPRETKDYPWLSAASLRAIRIEPFAINGPNIDDYLKRLPMLGRDIGYTLAAWAKEQNSSFGHKPQTAIEKAKSQTRP